MIFWNKGRILPRVEKKEERQGNLGKYNYSFPSARNVY